MKKEVILAISLGLFFGLLITLGLYRANSQKKPSESQIISPTPQVSPINAPVPLTIIDPIDGAVLATSTAILRGTINPQHYILVMDESTEYSVSPNNDGLFTQEFTLSPGTNLIDIFVFDDKTEIDHQQLNLVFTTNL